MLKMTTAKKRIYGLITAVVFAMTLLPLSGLFDRAGAAAAGTEGTSVTFNLEGSGTKESPYLIKSKDDLTTMQKAVDASYKPEGGNKKPALEAYYKLNDDITDLGNWTPIGRDVKFTGTFDGNGHKITGITVTKLAGSGRSNDNYYGFFGRLSAGGKVKNLTIEGTANIDGGWYVGLVVGLNEGTIENCFVKGTVTAAFQYGGITGMTTGNGAAINNCYADVNSNKPKASSNFGSIAGYIAQGATLSDSCYKNYDLPALGTVVASDPKTAVALTADEVAKGKAAWILRQNQVVTDGLYWGQKLGDGKEEVPSLKSTDGDKVFRAEFLLKTTNTTVTVAEEFANKDGTFAKPEVTYDKDGQTASDKWYKEADLTNEYSFDTQVSEDITLYSGASNKDYTITLDVGDGTLPVDSGWIKGDDGKYTKTYNKETASFELPTPNAPEGQKFAGWEANGNSGEQEKVTIEKGSTGNKSYTAKYRNAEGPVITVTLGDHKWTSMSTEQNVYVKDQTAKVTVTATDA